MSDRHKFVRKCSSGASKWKAVKSKLKQQEAKRSEIKRVTSFSSPQRENFLILSQENDLLDHPANIDDVAKVVDVIGVTPFDGLYVILVYGQTQLRTR